MTTKTMKKKTKKTTKKPTQSATIALHDAVDRYVAAINEYAVSTASENRKAYMAMLDAYETLGFEAYKYARAVGAPRKMLC